ncbi:hypothetical protein CANMA_002851 [Candida margitis]|uniref:uncharacterized protein n=1 Tax=Candida margitis TaxID=1775924 RepID=UPI002225D49D|nr:uncharacterized protein CANMA_002851 [Candida margitis]KAI5967671.1 hypothetical protein CANMA_002851 [Candida margitis]
MFNNPILDQERIYIQDDLSYNFANHKDTMQITRDDGLGGNIFWSIFNKVLYKITTLILSYFSQQPHVIESPNCNTNEVKEELTSTKDSDIEILGERVISRNYHITNDYHLINNNHYEPQNSILEDSFRDQVGNSTMATTKTTPHDSTSSLLRDLALKRLRSSRSKQMQMPQYGTDLSIASPMYSAPSQQKIDHQPIPQTPLATSSNDHPQFFDVEPKTEYQQSILNFYVPPRPISITSYSLIDDLIANFKIDRISETYKQAQSKTQDIITAKRLASKAKIEPLNDSQLAKVNQAWIANPRSICINQYSIDISYADLQTLKDGRWLNDNIIDFYLNLVMKQSPKVFIWTTHFYSTLASRGYSGVARWAKRKKVDLLAMDKVIVPVNISNTHWALAVVDNLQKAITYYDSLRFGQSGNPEAVKNLQMYMDNEAKRLGHDAIKYKPVPYIEAPQQKNGSDCGVFTCIAARYLAQNSELKYSQNDMKMIRRRMTFEIMSDQLFK